MKKIIKTGLALMVALIMTMSTFVVVSAEETIPSDNEVIIVTAVDEDGSTRAYELRWKFKEEFGHLYKRRWNATLGVWYDPAWILVY